MYNNKKDKTRLYNIFYDYIKNSGCLKKCQIYFIDYQFFLAQY
jgi:hypothetical protein